ncbi:MAG: helix-turn-helix domain-containing protein [Victivallaceae bacterium]|nr:helix-turn-helix domain-containing protein [Victivallaceae bacterium]
MENIKNKPSADGGDELFATPLTARLDDDADLPTLEDLEAERQKTAEEPAVESAPIPVQTARERRELPKILLPNHDKPPLAMPDAFSAGAFLKKVREDAKLSLKQVESATRIGQRYLESLENDDMRKMPPTVYVIAYLRKLADFYNISAESCERMTAALREQLNCGDLPDSIINQVELDTETTEADARELRKLCWIFGGAVAGFILLAVLLGVVFWHGSAEPAAPGAPVAALSAAKIDKLLPEPQIQVPELPEMN